MLYHFLESPPNSAFMGQRNERHFPVRAVLAETVHKTEGQTLRMAVVGLQSPFFSRIAENGFVKS